MHPHQCRVTAELSAEQNRLYHAINRREQIEAEHLADWLNEPLDCLTAIYGADRANRLWAEHCIELGEAHARGEHGYARGMAEKFKEQQLELYFDWLNNRRDHP